MRKDGKENEKKDTKEAFLIEALRLFAQKGYESVTVAQIAKAVNVSAPALYKHYGSKEELFRAIIELSDREFEKNMKTLHISYPEKDGTGEDIEGFTEEQQIENVINLFRITLHSEYPTLLRKLMQVEQFNMPEIADKYNERYVFHQIKKFERLFAVLMEKGILKKVDPEILAVGYLSPVILMIEICDRKPEFEEKATELLVEHIKEFNKNYRLK